MHHLISKHDAFIDVPLRVFVGYDHAESIAWHVLNHSIQRRASVPVSVTPVMMSQLDSKSEMEVMWREHDPMQSNEFAFSRWLVPFLAGFEGWAVFMDCDMVVRTDICELFHEADPHTAVQVVKHNHKPKEKTKYLGNIQTQYERKNWSSVMLFNCAHPSNEVLVPDNINEWHGLDLHQFKWLDEDLVGELPHEWNVLADYDSPEDYPDPKLIHYTRGGPWFHEFRQCDWADEWVDERLDMLHADQLEFMVRKSEVETLSGSG